jgi:hypothetical protein
MNGLRIAAAVLTGAIAWSVCPMADAQQIAPSRTYGQDAGQAAQRAYNRRPEPPREDKFEALFADPLPRMPDPTQPAKPDAPSVPDFFSGMDSFANKADRPGAGHTALPDSSTTRPNRKETRFSSGDTTSSYSTGDDTSSDEGNRTTSSSTVPLYTTGPQATQPAGTRR